MHDRYGCYIQSRYLPNLIRKFKRITHAELLLNVALKKNIQREIGCLSTIKQHLFFILKLL